MKLGLPLSGKNIHREGASEQDAEQDIMERK
jgi:hypothetical protein